MPLPTDDPARWRPNSDGGNAPAVSSAEPVDGRPALRFAYTNGKGYGNSLLEGVAIPPDATGVRFKLFVESAAPEAAMHLWLREKDGDLWMCRITPEDGEGISGITGAWRPVFVPFADLKHQPRGDKRRQFLSTDGMLMGFNFGDQTVRVADLALAVRASGRPPADTAAPAVSPVDPPGRRIAILREPTFTRQPGHADPERLAGLLRAAGFSPVFLRAADLCDPGRFGRKTADLVVLPCAPFFPQAGVPHFRAFLKAGGSFFSLGGYAFDRLCTYSDTGWASETLWPVAKEMDAVRHDAGWMNTRYGEPGDTMKLSRDQIGVFDPSFLLRHVASVKTAADQYVLPETWHADAALEGPAAVAMTGNNSPVFPDVYGRWIPLLETNDRFGRPRGPAAALALNYAGPYAGSNWGFCGVTNRDLFNGDYPPLDRLFVAACRRLLAPAYLMTLKSDFASYRPGETVTFSARVLAPTHAPTLAVRFRVGDTVIAETTVKDGVATATWALADAWPDFREFSAALLADGQPADILRSGFTVWNPARAQEGPRVKITRNYFDFNGRPLFFGGANTTGMMWYSDNEDPLVWRRDFERMGDFAMNTLRILHFSPFCNATNPAASRGSARELASRPEKTCRQTDAIVQLAQPNQVSIFLSLHDWMPLDLSASDLAAQQAWNRFWVSRYRDFPGMMYDIQNEPGTALNNAAVLRPLYEGWLAEKYGSLAAALAAWQGSGARPEIDFGAKPAGWDDLRARDNERFRAWIYARWQRANGEAVHEAAPHAPVTVGHLQHLTASEKVLDTSGIDFVNIHHYGEVSHLRGVLKLIDRRFEGKGFSLGEFGSKVAHTARNKGAWGDPAEDSVRHYLAVGHYALGMGASFVANWSWKDFRDSVFPWGVNHADLTPKPVLEAYRNMMLLFRPARPRYEPPQLWLVLPDSFRLGPDSARVHDGLRRAADALLGANAPFGVINEESLDRLPAEAKALVWPLAVCPGDAAFDRVASFVETGGRLLLTGDPRFDADRKPARLDRLARLGLPAVSEPPEPPFARKPAGLAEADVRLSSDGRVLWARAPVELLDGQGERALYRRFLDAVSGLPRVKVSPDDGCLLAFDVALQEGRAVAAVNTTTGAVQTVLAAHAGLPEIRAGLMPGRTLYVQVNAAGQVVAAASSRGLAVAGREVLTGEGDWAVLSLDGKDLCESAQVLALPFGPGSFGLARAAGASALAGEVGEFRAGVWTPLETQTLEAADGAVRGAADTVTAYDLRLLAAEGQMPAARERAERLLRVR
jgi:hypothetical protein